MRIAQSSICDVDEQKGHQFEENSAITGPKQRVVECDMQGIFKPW